MKITIFFLIFIGSSITFSQTFELLNDSDSPIGEEYMFISSNMELPFTKLHVANTSDSDETFIVKATEISNPTNETLQVCFGGGCFIVAPGTVDGYSPPAFETIGAGSSFDFLKIGPNSYTWEVGDSAVWDITLYNEADPLDSAYVRLTWKSNSLLGVDEDIEKSYALSVFPNPATDIVNVKTSDNTAFKEVRFINLQGEVVFQSTFSTQINVSALPSALYILEFIDDADNLTIQKIFIE